MLRWIFLLLALLGALAVSSARSQGVVYLSEVDFNPPNLSGVSESRLEWVELCAQDALELVDAALSDGRGTTSLPQVVFAPGECVVFAASERFYDLFTVPEDVQVFIVGTIGSRGLRNSGEVLTLLMGGREVDRVGWCDAGDLCPPEGQTLQRTATGWGTGDPTPGRAASEGAEPAPPSPTPEPGGPHPSGFWMYCWYEEDGLHCQEQVPVCPER